MYFVVVDDYALSFQLSICSSCDTKLISALIILFCMQIRGPSAADPDAYRVTPRSSGRPWRHSLRPSAFVRVARAILRAQGSPSRCLGSVASGPLIFIQNKIISKENDHFSVGNCKCHSSGILAFKPGILVWIFFHGRFLHVSRVEATRA